MPLLQGLSKPRAAISPSHDWLEWASFSNHQLLSSLLLSGLQRGVIAALPDTAARCRKNVLEWQREREREEIVIQGLFTKVLSDVRHLAEIVLFLCRP